MSTGIAEGKPSSYRDRDLALKEFVTQRVSTIQAQYSMDISTAVATLARLRRGVGRPAGSLPELYEPTLGGLPDILTDPSVLTAVEREGAATSWEQAAHDAITLYAWHQQSKRDRMHRHGAGFGAAMRLLGDRTSPEAVRRRFHAVGTAGNHDARLILLRGLISQLRAHAIALDYGVFAHELRRLNDRTYAHEVLLTWGRDYHRSLDTDSNSNHIHTDTTKGPHQ
ncbi:type I-E CRISPR-associated protein Cse2/CasB [Nocardia sp. NPDC052001]|uniref:type I-E CRISPR-associated protein Cse2/CasB n=1 Tax=Nocardia sp. NPDC052001 TaxID=3154853 RepID=UPI00342CC283